MNKKYGTIRENAFPYLMLAPSFILFSCFVLVPFLIGIYVSFFNWNGLGAMRFINIKNYLFTFRDAVFWTALKNTFVYALVVTAAKNIIGLFLAMLVARKFVGRTLFRVSMFMPVTFSYVVIGVLWSWIYNPDFGLLNNFLSAIGGQSLIHGWLSDSSIALFSVTAVDIWKWSGFHMILYLAGVQGIPKDFYEAASIDGANKIQQFFKITVPQLNAVIVINILLSLTGAFTSNYDIVNVMTGGGPYHSTEVALTYIVTQGFKLNAFGKACAMSMILFVLVLLFGILQVKKMSHDENYEN
ncbi:MAG TPA: sugar ABC transporter permease [Clostridia bacterium]|nr:sugar ABC transporter permease [Clostridia bacterium]